MGTSPSSYPNKSHSPTGITIECRSNTAYENMGSRCPLGLLSVLLYFQEPPYTTVEIFHPVCGAGQRRARAPASYPYSSSPLPVGHLDQYPLPTLLRLLVLEVLQTRQVPLTRPSCHLGLSDKAILRLYLLLLA